MELKYCRSEITDVNRLKNVKSSSALQRIRSWTIANKNIDNITSLWITVGNSLGIFHQQEKFSYVYQPGSFWPNRLWLHHKTEVASLETIADFLDLTKYPLAYSHWSALTAEEPEILLQKGLVKRSEQIGMSMDLEKYFDIPRPRLDLIRVKTKHEASIWEELYLRNFGYIIDTTVFVKPLKSIPLYLIRFLDHYIGTAMTFLTPDVIGIYCLGIIQEYRRKGYAEEALAILLNEAMDSNITTGILQASAIGKNIYSRMGFHEDFSIKNYKLSL